MGYKVCVLDYKKKLLKTIKLNFFLNKKINNNFNKKFGNNFWFIKY